MPGAIHPNCLRKFCFRILRFLGNLHKGDVVDCSRGLLCKAGFSIEMILSVAKRIGALDGVVGVVLFGSLGGAG